MIACLSVSYFASAVERRDNAALQQAPLVVGGQNWEPRPLFGYSREAALRGVAPGMSLRQAHLLSPDSHFLPASVAKYQGVAGEIVDVLTDFTHLVEPVNLWQLSGKSSGFIPTPARALPAQYYLDLESLPQKEATALAQEIGRTVRKQTRLAPSLGLAAGPFTARVAATMTRPNHLRPVAPDEERAFLAEQSVTNLPLDQEMARRLRLLGIRTIGQFVALPQTAVQQQFGPDALPLYRLARGEAEAKPRPRQATPDLHLALQFEPPLEERLTLQAVLERLATELAGRLQEEHRAAGSLAFTVEDAQGARRVAQPLRQPLQSAEHIQLQLHALLERFSLRAPVTAVTLSAGHLTASTAQQLSLFTPPAPNKLAQLLPALMARHRTAAFYRPQLADRAHPLPERRFQLQPL